MISTASDTLVSRVAVRDDVIVSSDILNLLSLTLACAAASRNPRTNVLRSRDGRMVAHLRIFAIIRSLSVDADWISSSSLTISD